MDARQPMVDALDHSHAMLVASAAQHAALQPAGNQAELANTHAVAARFKVACASLAGTGRPAQRWRGAYAGVVAL